MISPEKTQVAAQDNEVEFVVLDAAVLTTVETSFMVVNSFNDTLSEKDVYTVLEYT